MNEYINNWIVAIEGKNQNTYKLAFTRAILELVVVEKKPTISFEDLAINTIAYYWNQMFFFDLKQSDKGDAAIEKKVQELIDDYKVNNSQIKKPFWAIHEELNQKLLRKAINKAKTTLRTMPAYHLPNHWDFENINCLTENKQKTSVANLIKREKILFNELYAIKYTGEEYFIEFTNEQFNALLANSERLRMQAMYKWAKLVENYNYTPRILNKMALTNTELDEKFRRSQNLSNFHKVILIASNEKFIDFYTKEDITDCVSVDHFIPWSVCLEDKVWNLVFTSKSNNSSMGNKKKSEIELNNVLKRNDRLIHLLQTQPEYSELANLYLKELIYAKEFKLLEKAYYSFM